MNVFDLDINVEETGPLTVLLDSIAENGVPAAMQRAFAAWLGKVVETLQDERDRWKEDYKDLKDEHPDQVVIPPEASSFYHVTKEGAETVMNRLLEDPRVAGGAVQLQPYNGWMVVVVPKLADLSDLSYLAEIQDGTRRPGPTGRLGPAMPATAPDGASGGRPGASDGSARPAPTKGATAQVWAIADAVVKQGGWTRAAIISACVTAGINPATAGTQFSKWKKERGL